MEDIPLVVIGNIPWVLYALLATQVILIVLLIFIGNLATNLATDAVNVLERIEAHSRRG